MKKIIFMFFLFLIIFVYTASAANATAFVYPDDVLTVNEFVKDSQNLRIAVYTYEDPYLELPVNTTIIAEKSPVGGIENKWLLCDLQKKGTDVFLYNGELRFMHAKYMIKNGAVLVSTENIGPRNRGWGIVVYDAAIAAQLNEVFEKDLENSEKLVCKGDEKRKDIEKKDGFSYFQKKTFEARAELLVTPGAEKRVLEILDGAEKNIYVQQLYIYKNFGDAKNPMLEKLIEKARSGVEVKILLDSTYYNKEKNSEVIDYVNDIAKKENLDMEARFIKNTYFFMSHVKGVIADDNVIISSINWNENSLRKNREAGIIISDREGFYKTIFLADWNSDYKEKTTGNAAASYSIVVGVLVVLAVAAIVVYAFYRKRG